MTTNILILCPDNAARSVLCEGMLNHWAGRFRRSVCAYSAGHAPHGAVDARALDALAAVGVDVSGLRTKGLDEFRGENAPRMRVVISVSDDAESESPFHLPGGPLQVCWNCPDPLAAPEPERRDAFELTRRTVGEWMLQLVALPLERMADRELKGALLGIPVSYR